MIDLHAPCEHSLASGIPCRRCVYDRHVERSAIGDLRRRANEARETSYGTSDPVERAHLIGMATAWDAAVEAIESSLDDLADIAYERRLRRERHAEERRRAKKA